MTAGASAEAWQQPGTSENIVSRMERTPFSSWQVKARLLIGTGTFFDAFDALAIAQVLPVLTPLWHLNPAQVANLIAIGYLGQLFGALLFSWISERHGRLVGISAAIVTFSLFSIGCATANGYSMLLVFRFLQGLGLGGEVPIGAVYINEITKAKGRGRFVLLFELVFSVGVVFAGLAGRWVVPHLGWHYMFIIGMLPILVVPMILKWLPESPRWLANHQQTAKADAAMGRMEKGVQRALGTPLPEPQPQAVHVKEKPGRFAELLSPQYRTRTLTVWTIWFATYVVYYGLGTWLPSLYRSTYGLPLEKSLTYGLIGNLFTFTGAALCAFFIDALGRRRTFLICMSLTAFFLGVLALTGAHSPTDVLIWGNLAYLFAGALSIGLYLYTPEIYPTRIRAIGVGTATGWLRIASMIGPLIIGNLIGFGLPVICIVFAVVALLATFVIYRWAIETKQRVLEEVSR